MLFLFKLTNGRNSAFYTKIRYIKYIKRIEYCTKQKHTDSIYNITEDNDMRI